MADDPWKRFRKRQEQKKPSLISPSSATSPRLTRGLGRKTDPKENPAKSVTELVETIDSLVEQVATLFNQYFAGSEKLPPLERRKQLDQTVIQLRSISRAVSADRFRASTTVARWKAYSDRWDKQLLLLEKGKFKRRA